MIVLVIKDLTWIGMTGLGFAGLVLSVRFAARLKWKGSRTGEFNGSQQWIFV